jgi:hypothetical protein
MKTTLWDVLLASPDEQLLLTCGQVVNWLIYAAGFSGILGFVAGFYFRGKPDAK